MSVSCNKAVNLARIFPVCSDIVISVHYICHINNQRHKIMKSRLWLSVCLPATGGRNSAWRMPGTREGEAARCACA